MVARVFGVLVEVSGVMWRNSDFMYELPDELIARFPLAERSAARLLLARAVSVDEIALADRMVRDLPDLLEPDDLLVFNNTRVLPARLFGQKATGGKIEALIERVLDEHTALARIRSSKSPKAGTELIFEGSLHATMTERVGELVRPQFPHRPTDSTLLNVYGAHPPPSHMVLARARN